MSCFKVWDAVTNNEALNFVKSKIENKLRSVFHLVYPSLYLSVTCCRDKLVLSNVCEELLDTCCKKTVEK